MVMDIWPGSHESVSRTFVYVHMYVYDIRFFCSVYELTPWSRVFLENLTSSQLVEKFPALYGT